MIRNKKFLICYKLVFGLLGFSAIVTEIATIVERGRFNPVNFFSFFTIETNILVVVTLLLSAIALTVDKRAKIDILRGMTTVYILIVGIGFSFLLAGLEDVALTAVPWDNTVLHYIMPIAVAVDFLIDRPSHKLRFRPSLAWLLFPIIYIIYSLVRGAATGWYPYPFLNSTTNGYGALVSTILGLLLLALGLIWCTTKLARQKQSTSG